jgi:hypothetical protein
MDFPIIAAFFRGLVAHPPLLPAGSGNSNPNKRPPNFCQGAKSEMCLYLPESAGNQKSGGFGS